MENNEEKRGWLAIDIHPWVFFTSAAIIIGSVALAIVFRSHSGTNLIIFDRWVQYGDIGGPLVSVNGGHVIGVIGGVFDPVELEGLSTPEGVMPINSDLSYATSIEYGKQLLAKALEE